jgi:hypothetical protein
LSSEVTLGSASLSLKALTLTGATVGTITAEAVAFAIGAIDDLATVGLLTAGADVMLPLEGFDECVWLSEVERANEVAVGDWRREDVESGMGDSAEPLSSLTGATEPLEVGVVTF